MNKILTLFAVLFAANLSFAQPDVVTAYNLDKDGKYLEAAAAIDRGVEHPSCQVPGKKRTKAWFYRGNIYTNVCLDSASFAQRPDALEIARDSYFKCLEYDEKKQYAGQINTSLDKLVAIANNQAIFAYESGDFVSSGKYFLYCADLNQRFGVVDTSAIWSAALSYENGQMWPQAIEQYSRLTELGYKGGDTFGFISYCHVQNGDDEAAIAALQAGREKYPNDVNLILKELSFYINGDQPEKAMEVLNIAMEKDPNNVELPYNAGILLDQLGNYEEAVANLEKALVINPEHVNSLYQLGAMHYNKSVEMRKAANEIDNRTKYEAAKKEADDVLNSSLPFLEKALELSPQDEATLIALKNAYTYIGDEEKYNEIKERLDAVQGAK